MNFVGGILVISGFVLLFKLFGLFDKSSEVICIAKSAVSIVRNGEMDDYQKEILMQNHAKDLFLLFFSIIILSILAIAIPISFIWLMEYAELISVNEVIEMTLSWEFIAASLVFSIFFFNISARKK